MADEEKAGETTALQAPKGQSIREQLKDARNTKSTLSAADKLCLVFGGTIWATIVLLVLCGIPIAMIVIGATHLNDCPIERFIPIWLIVAGSFATFNGLSTFFARVRAHWNKSEEVPWELTPCDGLIGCFLIIWFICGTVWVFMSYGNLSEDPASLSYCDPMVYEFAFWIIVFAYCFLWLGVLGWCCCRLCCSTCMDPVWDRV